MPGSEGRPVAEQLLRAIADSTLDCIFVKDRERRYTFVNRAACRLLGLAPEQLIGKRPEELDEAGVPFISEALDRQCLDGAEAHDHVIVELDGEERVFHTAQLPIREVSGEVSGLCGVVRDITAQVRAEEEARLHRERLRGLAHHLTVVEEHERQLISDRIQEDLGHALAMAKLRLGGLAQALDDKEMVAQVAGLANMCGRAMRIARQITIDLTTPVLRQRGLRAAAKELCLEQDGTGGVRVRYEEQGEAVEPDREMSVLAFRAVRELLGNAVRHALAREAVLRVVWDPHRITFTVQDDGQGFDPGAIGQGRSDSGMGLFHLKERLAYVGGRFRLLSAQGQGTTVTVELPVRR